MFVHRLAGLSAVALPLLVACAHAPSQTASTPCALDPEDAVRFGAEPPLPECAVDRRATQVNASTVRIDYRPTLETEGCITARVRFVVDTSGVPETLTARILSTNDFAYAQAVLQSMRFWRYSPARRAGHKVRQLVTDDRTIVMRVEVVRVPVSGMGGGMPPSLPSLPRSGPPRC
jgi:hypothetical protein